MKRFVIFVAGVILFVSCKQGEGKQFSVTGTIKNREVKKIYLEIAPATSMQRMVVDSAVLEKDGKFTLTTRTKEEEIYNLRLDDDVYPFASLINDTEKLSVEVDYTDRNEFYKITGSPNSIAIKDYLKKSGEQIRHIFGLQKEIDSLKNSKGDKEIIEKSDSAKTIALQELKFYVQQSISKAGSPSLAMFMLRTYQGIAKNPNSGLAAFDDEVLLAMLMELEGKFPARKDFADIRKSFQSQLNISGLIGKTAPDISLPDTEGNIITLSSFRGKYVLVDFWASWCRPCRMENPNVVAAYNKFRNKNFTILGVSLDDNKDAWIKAIVNDGLNWKHVCDLTQQSSQGASLYKVSSIPYNVLVGPDGKIIAESLRGEALQNKLEEVLQ